MNLIGKMEYAVWVPIKESEKLSSLKGEMKPLFLALKKGFR
jgi:hypothetical protein